MKDLTIVANTGDFPSAIESETGVQSKALGDRPGDREHKGFINSLKAAFEGNDHRERVGLSYYDRLVGLGIDKTAARQYENDIDSGKMILLADNGSESLAGYSIATDTNDRTSLKNDTIGADEDRSLKLREEQLGITKDRVQTGEVEVHKDVVEEQKTVHVPVTHEEVYVERRPVEQSAADTPIGDDKSIRVPIVEEKVEVTKKPVITE